MRCNSLFGVLAGAWCVAGSACEDSAGKATDTAEATSADTSVATETSDPTDGIVDDEGLVPPDTNVATETATDDTTPSDTTANETEPSDTTTEVEVVGETCGCAGGASCLQALDPVGCVALTTSCGGAGGLHRVDACEPGEAEASCKRGSTIQYHYWARIDGWLQDAKDACAQTTSGSAGTFSVATIPAGVGAPCSCQRTASACVEVYGDACAALTCDAPEGKQATLCPSANHVPGRCVTRDGQRELVFYGPGANPESAEMSCNGASVVDYYWFPDGL